MDCARSRIFLWTGGIVLALILGCVFIYSELKKPAQDIGNPGDKLNNNEERKTMESVPTVTISDYNPLEEEGFKRETDWGELRTHGPMSASAADFKRDMECRRVVVFQARGTILGHILSSCDSLEPAMGLMMVKDILYYYGRAMEREGPTEDMFTVAKKVIGERKCVMTSYTVDGDDRPKLEKKSEPKEVYAYDDKDCKVLVDFKMPPMLLLSRNGATGMFTPGKNSQWSTINPWEPLGAITRLYWSGAKCFRLLVITSFGRSVQAVKVSCGPIQNLIVTDNVLYYGDALSVRRNSEANTFVFVYNPKRSGDCVKKTVTLSIKEGKSVVSVISKENLSDQDKECHNLVNGDISGAVLNKVYVARLVRKLQLDDFDVETYGTSLKSFNQYSQWSYYNLPMELGMAVAYYKVQEGLSIRKLVLLVARGVPITATLLDSGPTRRVVIRAEELYYDTDSMIKKTKDGKFIILIKKDEYNCYKKTYVLKTENGMTVKEEVPSGGEVTKRMDEDCRNLIEGKKLKNPKLGNFNHETDEYGVPYELPNGVSKAEDSSSNPKKENRPNE